MRKSPIDETNANLKIVPYYVTKNPSEPSFIGSLMSYILRVPWSFSSIQHKIQKLIRMKSTDMSHAKTAIKFEDLSDMNIEKNIRRRIGIPIAATLTVV